MVIYEISSYPGYVDLEGLSFKISFNGDTLITASAGDASAYDVSGVEATNQIVFDLYDFGFTDGDILGSIYIENVYSDSSTSDPDFIFVGIASTSVVPIPSAVLLCGLGICFGSKLRRRNRL